MSQWYRVQISVIICKACPCVSSRWEGIYISNFSSTSERTSKEWSRCLNSNCSSSLCLITCQVTYRICYSIRTWSWGINICSSSNHCDCSISIINSRCPCICICSSYLKSYLSISSYSNYWSCSISRIIRLYCKVSKCYSFISII